MPSNRKKYKKKHKAGLKQDQLSSSECSFKEQDEQAPLEWIRHEPVPPHLRARVPDNVLASFRPRVLPRCIVNHAKGPSVPIPETKYLISWTNSWISIGFACNPFECENPDLLPVVCQFGSWETTEQRSLRTGSIVMVKGYAGLLYKDGTTRKRCHFNEPFSNFVENGVPYPTVMATEWALVSKPKLFRTLGVLQKFHATYLIKNDIVLSGQAFDQEQNVIVDVSDDLFASNIRKELQVDSALVLTWIRLNSNEKYGIYSTEPQKRRNFLLPTWMMEKFPEVKCLADTHWLEQVHANFV